jgi:hypothetical protein
MALLISTQYLENYAFTPEGEVDYDSPRWKAKGGTDILITGVDVESTPMEVDYVLDAIRYRIERNDGFSWESIIGWQLVPEDFFFGDWRDEFLERTPNPRF